MREIHRNTWLRSSLAGMAVLATATFAVPSKAQIGVPPDEKGRTYSGTFQSTGGHGGGTFSLKISSDKLFQTARQAKGTLKWGKTAYKFSGTISQVNGSVIINGAGTKGRSPVVGLTIENADSGAGTGGYTVITLQQQELDHGNVSGVTGR